MIETASNLGSSTYLAKALSLTTSGTMTKSSSARQARSSKKIAQDDIRKLVSSWGGFEKLVAELSNTGNVFIEHNAIVEGKSGAKRQIDVLLRHSQGLYDHTIVAECKYWNKSVSRLHVDALITTVHEINASKGVIFSTIGFQSGAITQAKASGIELYTIRLPSNREWGNPGRYINFYYQIIHKSMANLTIKKYQAFGITEPVNVELHFDEVGDGSSKTNILRPLIESADTYPQTLEDLIRYATNQAVLEAWKPALVKDGEKWIRRIRRSVSFKPSHEILIQLPNGFVMISEICFDIGISITQAHFTLDRADRFAFVFALDDHIRNITKSISKEKDGTISMVGSLNTSQSDLTQEKPLNNGSIMPIYIKPLANFEEFSNMSFLEERDETY